MRQRSFSKGWLPLTFGLCGLLSLCHCDRQQPPPAGLTSDYFQEVREHRLWKDTSFKEGPQSPLPEPDRPQFRGLKYFAINPDLRLNVALKRFATPDTVYFMTNTGSERPVLRLGAFDFTVRGTPQRLVAFRMLDNPVEAQPHLFVPFFDATSGGESYGGGRYLDLEGNVDGKYVLDFNLAYNPYCAYGRSYVCPLPPDENILTVEIRAGEKKWH